MADEPISWPDLVEVVVGVAAHDVAVGLVVVAAVEIVVVVEQRQRQQQQQRLQLLVADVVNVADAVVVGDGDVAIVGEDVAGGGGTWWDELDRSGCVVVVVEVVGATVVVGDLNGEVLVG